MKSLITITMLVVALATASAQSFPKYYSTKKKSFRVERSYKPKLEAGYAANRSIRGWYTGWQLNLNFSNKFQLGYFSTVRELSTEGKKHTDRGLNIAYLFRSQKRFQFGPKLKVMVSDKRFVSLIPLMEGKYRMSSRLSTGLGVGVSDRYPMFDGRLTYRLF